MREVLKELRTKTNQSGLWITGLFLGFLACVLFGYYMLNPIHLIWLIPLMGWIQYYIVISGHEAVHKTLCPNSTMNEFIGVVGQAMVGVNFTAYRLQHMDHHMAPDDVNDPDAHIYMGVLRQQPGIRRFLWLTLGTFIEIIIKIRQKGIEGYGTERSIEPRLSSKMRRDSVLVILMQSGIMVSSWFILGIDGVFTSFIGETEGLMMLVHLGLELVLSYAIVWTIPLFFITVFLNRCRIVIEHGLGKLMADELEVFNGPRIPTVEVVPSKIEQWIFSPFNFNYHCTHHTFMTIPHYNLPALNKYLFNHHYDDGNKYGLLKVERGYLHALWTVVNHPVVIK